MSGQHSRLRTRRNTGRRSLTAALLAVATSAGFLVAAGPASAAGPWFVATTGSDANACTTLALPCKTVGGAIAKAAFAAGDTITVQPGVYPSALFQTKGANIVGNGAGVIFDGGGTTFAMGTLYASAQTLNLTNLTLRNGKTNTGGALAIGNGTIVANNVTLSGSSSPFGGGAYVAQGASLTMTGGSIINNTSTASATALSGAGAGVYVVGKVGTTTPAGSLTLNNVTVTNNIANGAATAAGGNGGAIFNAGNTTINGSTFSANQAVASTNTNARRGQGGAIFNGPNDADDAPTMAITNTTITGGLAASAFNASSGGAIANDDTTVSGFGTAGVLTATNVTMTGNTALIGGGLYNGGTATVTGGAVQTNTAFSGGGVYQSPLIGIGSAHPVATFDGTVFTGNVANNQAVASFGNGGAIYNGDGLTVKNATFSANQAVTSSAGSTIAGYGGAIYNGPATASDIGQLTITDSTINGGGVANAFVGGAIANGVNGKVTATRITLLKNTAQAAGGVYAGGDASFTDSTFDQNKATNTGGGFGGAIYAAKAGAASPVVTLDNTDLTNNTAAVVGGGIALVNGVTLEVRNGSTVDHNTAVDGGGIFNGGALTVRGSEVNANTASYQGGGIYSGSTTATDTPSVTLINAAVDDNTAANLGGGIVTFPGSSITGTGGEISRNSAVGAGGIYVGDNAPASFDSTDFVGNTASASGGGAILNSGVLKVVHSLLSGNHALHTTPATGLGAAIYSGSNNDNVSTKLTVDASTITGNDAYAGAALVTLSAGTGSTNLTSIDRSTITGNTNSSVTAAATSTAAATVAVGAIEQFHPLTITNSTIKDNTAQSGGAGALTMVDPAHVSLAGNIFSGNGGHSCSAAPVDGGYNLTDPGDSSCGFTVANHDVLAAPQLGVLTGNGGDTPTFLPGPASPALDRVPAGTGTGGITNVVTGNAVVLCAAAAKDQRETARPQGAKCDIGSVEVVQVAPTVHGADSVDYSVGNMGTPELFTTDGTPQATLSEAGALPAGVTFVDNGDGTGTLSGTPGPGTGGDYPITVKGANEAGTGTKTFHLFVHQAPVLGGPASDTYTVGSADGLAGPDLFNMTAGYPDATLSTTSALPGGVHFDGSTPGHATISGTPVVGSGGVYVIHVKGSNGTPPDYDLTFTLTVNEGPTVQGPANDVATVGTGHSSAEYTTTGTPTPTLSATGLPAGLALTGSGPGKARIAGTAANGTGGTYVVTVTATNNVGVDASTITHLTVNEAPELTGPSEARVVTGTATTIGFSADGYPGATVTESGDLPAGLHFDNNGSGGGGASITGTATAGTDGVYHLTITASNGINPDAVIHLTLTVVPHLSISTTSMPSATFGSAYSAPVQAVGGQPTYSFTLVGGALPAGLTMASNGTISGTPTAAPGVYTFKVKAVDGSTPQEVDTKDLSITVGRGATTLAVDPVLLKTNLGLLGIQLNIGIAEATLTGGSPAHPVGGQQVDFKVGLVTVCSGITAADGTVTCTMSVTNTLLAILSGGVSASYAGNTLWQPATGSAGLISLH